MGNSGMEQQGDYIYDIHVSMRDNNVLLAYTGELDMKIINALITSVKFKLKEVEHTPRIQKRIYGIMVESLEAVHRGYAITQKKNKKINLFSIFTLSFDKDYYYLVSGNYVFNEDIELQKAQIDKINALNIDGKKKLYRDCISDGNMNEHNADLAIVDIAIKSNNVLTYEFRKVDDLTSFYIFLVKIKSN